MEALKALKNRFQIVMLTSYCKKRVNFINSTFEKRGFTFDATYINVQAHLFSVFSYSQIVKDFRLKQTSMHKLLVLYN